MWCHTWVPFIACGPPFFTHFYGKHSKIYRTKILLHTHCLTGYPYISWKYDLSFTSCNLLCLLKISYMKLQPVKYDYIWHIQSAFQPPNKKGKSSVGLVIKLEVKLAYLPSSFEECTVCVWASTPAIQGTLDTMFESACNKKRYFSCFWCHH